VAENVAALHRWLIAVEQVQIRAADGAGRNLDDGVPRILDLRIRNRIDANVAFSMPAECAHYIFLKGTAGL